MIEPVIKIGGSAFCGNTTQAHRPVSEINDPDNPKLDRVKVVSLKEWCDRNFVSRDTGYKLIKLRLLVAFRRHGYWWVSEDPECIPQILELLGIEELNFVVNPRRLTTD